MYGYSLRRKLFLQLAGGMDREEEFFIMDLIQVRREGFILIVEAK